MKGAVIIFFIYLLNATNSSRIQLTLSPKNGEIGKKREVPRVTFVKRLVPHEYQSPPFEYDEKSRAIFVPKYRIRNRINLNTNEEFSPKDVSLKQPYKAFEGEDEKEDYKSASDMDGHGRKLYYIVSGKDETDLKPINRNAYKVNYSEYEKPWQDSRIFTTGWHQKKKRLPRFGSLDELMTMIQTNGEYKRNPKAIYSIYSQGPVWQTVEKNPRHEERNIKSYLVDDLVKKLEEAVQSSRNDNQSDNKMRSAESAPYAVLMLRNENTKPDNMNKLYEVLKHPLSAEVRQETDEIEDNETPKKENIQALKNVDALLNALEKEADSKLKNKTKQHINVERKSDVSSKETFRRPIERPETKDSNKLEDLLKTLLGNTERHDRVDSESDSSVSTEVEHPIDVIEKHKVQMIPPLKSEHGKGVNPEKLVLVVRNLGDLVKLWKYVQGEKGRETLLRGRATNSVVLDVDEPPVESKPFNYPHYSIWNYWTYDKNLFHDNCPGEQAKVGDTCIWTPPHRK